MYIILYVSDIIVEKIRNRDKLGTWKEAAVSIVKKLD